MQSTRHLVKQPQPDSSRSIEPNGQPPKGQEKKEHDRAQFERYVERPRVTVPLRDAPPLDLERLAAQLRQQEEESMQHFLSMLPPDTVPRISLATAAALQKVDFDATSSLVFKDKT